MIPKEAIDKPATRWQRTYLAKHPWMKHLTWARSRAKRKGMLCILTSEQAKLLWFNAKPMERPSIDRIDPRQGYSFANCRFIELSENCRRDKIGRPSTERQREAARKNLIWDGKHEGLRDTGIVAWQRNAHRFYDLILTGGDTDAFWKELLTSKE